MAMFQMRMAGCAVQGVVRSVAAMMRFRSLTVPVRFRHVDR